MAVYFGNKIFMYNPIGDVRCSSYSVKGVHAWKPLQSVEHGKDFNLELDLITDYPMAKWIAVPVLIFEEIKPDWSLYMKETWGVKKPDFIAIDDPYEELMEDHNRRMMVFKKYETVVDLRAKKLNLADVEAGALACINAYGQPRIRWNHDRTKPIGKLVKNCGSNTYRIVSYPLTTLQITKTLAPGDKMEISVYGKTYDITSAASYGATEIKIYEGKEEGICVVANTGYAALHYPVKEATFMGSDIHEAMRYAMYAQMLGGLRHRQPNKRIESADVTAPLQKFYINGINLCPQVRKPVTGHYKHGHKALSFRYYNPMLEKGNIIPQNDITDGYKQHYDTIFAGLGEGMVVPRKSIVSGGKDLLWLVSNETELSFTEWQEYLLKIACATFNIHPSVLYPLTKKKKWYDVVNEHWLLFTITAIAFILIGSALQHWSGRL